MYLQSMRFFLFYSSINVPASAFPQRTSDAFLKNILGKNLDLFISKGA
jgi:hypothetical protein